MSGNDLLSRMAELILEDPVITVSELARRLGYAEDKTIYYWIAKAHYRGLRSFKRAVLKGHYRLPMPSQAREAAGRYGRIPVAHGFDENGRPLVTDDHLWLPNTEATSVVWRYPGPALGGVLPGDLLLLAVPPAWPPGHGYPLCVSHAPTRAPALRTVVHTTAGQPLLVDPVTWQVDQEGAILYTVVQLLRPYGPAPPLAPRPLTSVASS